METFFIFLDKLNHMYIFPNYSVNVISPAYQWDQCVALLASFLQSKIFLHESSSVSTSASYSLLWRHSSASLFSLVWWNTADHSQGKVRGASKEPESCPSSQAGWLEQTHCFLMTARSKSAKPFSSLDAAAFYAGACSPAMFSFRRSSSPGFIWAFPGTRAIFYISTAPSTAAP